MYIWQSQCHDKTLSKPYDNIPKHFILQVSQSTLKVYKEFLTMEKYII